MQMMIRMNMTAWQQGPVATAMLADLGAEVIHVESPMGGDPGRGAMRYGGLLAVSPEGRNYYIEMTNRNKLSIAVNLKKEAGRKIIYQLIEKSDIFVQNFRSGVADELGVDYETLSSYNPRLVYAAAWSYGPRGPEASLETFDLAGQARSGFMMTIGKPNTQPCSAAVGLADQMGAIMLSYGILSALVARERLGIGQRVDTSHLGSMIFLQGLNISSYLMIGKEAELIDQEKPGNALWNWYRCQDGLWILLASAREDLWPMVCRALVLEHLEKDSRFATLDLRRDNAGELVKILNDVFATKPRHEWLRSIRETGAICDSVNRVEDVVNDPQAIENEYIRDFDHPVFGTVKTVGLPVELSKTPVSIRMPAPELGQHTEEVLLNLCGYTWEDIEQLKSEGVIL